MSTTGPLRRRLKEGLGAGSSTATDFEEAVTHRTAVASEGVETAPTLGLGLFVDEDVVFLREDAPVHRSERPQPSWVGGVLRGGVTGRVTRLSRYSDSAV